MIYAIPIRTDVDVIVISTIKTVAFVTTTPVTTVTAATTSTNTINLGIGLSPLILQSQM